MTHSTQGDDSDAGGQHGFNTTHWSVVLKAQNSSALLADAALEKLCRTYWYPLYVYLRREGKDKTSAEDLVQGFFARLLEKNFLDSVRREKGKFRSFLLAALKHYMLDEWDKARAQKRGGGQKIVPLDDVTGEERYHHEPADRMDAEKLYERRWALTLLEQAQVRLRQEYAARGKSNEYDRLVLYLDWDDDAPSYADAAAELGVSLSALKSSVKRLRERHQELVREEVANTVESLAEVDEEIRHLISVVSA